MDNIVRCLPIFSYSCFFASGQYNGTKEADFVKKSQRFSDIFEDLPFSDKLEKRIANLTNLLSETVSSGSDRGTFVRIYDWKDSTDTMLEILEN